MQRPTDAEEDPFVNEICVIDKGNAPNKFGHRTVASRYSPFWLDLRPTALGKCGKGSSNRAATNLKRILQFSLGGQECTG